MPKWKKQKYFIGYFSTLLQNISIESLGNQVTLNTNTEGIWYCLTEHCRVGGIIGHNAALMLLTLW